MAGRVGTDVGLVGAKWRIAHTKMEATHVALTGSLPKGDRQRQKVARLTFWTGF
jgi:hypothetical protein